MPRNRFTPRGPKVSRLSVNALGFPTPRGTTMNIASLDNPDYVHLKSLSDMLKQVVTWARAADAQVQILLAKRAPVMAPPMNVPVPASINDPHREGKIELWSKAVSLGIPTALLGSPDYLGKKGRPKSEGIVKTKTLIEEVKARIAEGRDPSDLWITSAP